MVGDDMKLSIFHGNGSEDPEQHRFLFEVIWTVNQVQDDNVKRAQLIMTFQGHALDWIMKFSIVSAGSHQNKLEEIQASLKD